MLNDGGLIIQQSAFNNTTGCDTATDLGAKAFMPYTADYVFYKKN